MGVIGAKNLSHRREQCKIMRKIMVKNKLLAHAHQRNTFYNEKCISRENYRIKFL